MSRKNNVDHPLMYKIVMLSAGLLLGLILSRLFFFIMKVETESMSPSLKTGDRVVISRFASAGKGDIVAVESPADEGRLILSRIIASEFETVEIRNRVVYINDTAADFKWNTIRKESLIYPMKFTCRDNMPPVKLGKDEYFLLGDNFDSSYDSRIIGAVPEGLIEGRIIYKW
ncbi:MAG TPA: signal peptidase I [Spirochaetota bacterium]|nr:signal peptidase I [Spirochaetota bacterium]HPF06828.1 signal peptidase I [Spirochaetota bacterium]HPJ43271.1 signal peptidase I [Spirochaetota bacterium]HPR38005.1 signal peptidase I [Spirochaetota bacterium]HRX48164.1 signal peptidase I [Spirochaetota bacterium]